MRAHDEAVGAHKRFEPEALKQGGNPLELNFSRVRVSGGRSVLSHGVSIAPDDEAEPAACCLRSTMSAELRRMYKEVIAVSAVGNPVLVVVLSLVAGLLVGGVWSSYQRGASRAVTAVLALLAVMAVVFAVLVLVEVM